MDPQDPIAVLHVVGSPDSPGVTVAASTRDAGDRATVLVTGGDGGDLPELPGVEIAYVPDHPSLAARLERDIAGFDLVEVHDVADHPASVVRDAALRGDVPFVVHTHGVIPSGSSVELLRDAAGVRVTTHREQAALAALDGGIRTVVSAPSVPSPRHDGDREAFRARHDLDHEHRLVLCLGPLGPTAGVQRLIAAFEPVADDEPEARLVIAGSGPEDAVAGIHARVAASRHAGSILVIGDLSGQERADALHSADLFALHPDEQTLGITAAEALSQGTPVLLSDAVLIADDVVAVGGGEVVPRFDETALAERLAYLLTDPIAVRRLCAGTGIAAAPYLPERVAHRDAALRRELLASLRPLGAETV